jgi:hypothetical protein
MTISILQGNGLRNNDTITIRNVDVVGVGTLVDLADTPNSYDDGKALVSTTSGTEWQTIDAMQSHGNEYHDPDFATEQALATTSGALQGQIDLITL